ncbi:divergent polysaccharide deacetylase family protein [Geoalkalibacter subterraneus]|uniref:divergent polysaccharide deacetylase family protein n=1 Tax=Geoalkalibacter subterraneus TaxID=483547 RepID=UPI0011852B2D|nr:divergent polysaccharide deacetylase family protein [Geoalkalibacter subterraneus]
MAPAKKKAPSKASSGKTPPKTPPKKTAKKAAQKAAKKAPQKTTPAASGGKSPRSRNPKVTAGELKIWVALLCVVIFLVAAVALLQKARKVFDPGDADPVPVASTEVEKLGFEQARTIFEQAMDEIVDGPSVERTRSTDSVAYRILNEDLSQEEFTHLEAVLGASPGQWRLNRPQTGHLVARAEDRWQFELLFVTPPSPPPLENVEQGPRVAIIMDDMGNDTFSTRELLAIDLEVTFAVLPETESSTETARLAHAQGREVMLHLPMEPIGYPQPNPGRNALLISLSAEQIRARMASYLQQVPHAVGGNNHMGSRFTQHEEGMRVVLDELARHNLFFVDSLTTNGSVTRRLAADRGVPFGRRSLFLDNDADVEKVRQQIRKLISLALREGEAVGICHPYPETMEALRREQESFAAAGVKVVPMSHLVRSLPRS